MSAQPDPDIPQAPNSANDPRAGADAASGQPPEETVTLGFEELLLFPEEGHPTVESGTESVDFVPRRQPGQLPPGPLGEAGPEGLNNDGTAREDLRAQLREAEAAIQELLGKAGVVKADLDQLGALAAQLTRDCSTIVESSREAGANSATAMATLRDIEQRIDALTALRPLATQAHERLSALDVLAESVMVKSKTIENQKSLIESTLIDANRLNEMVRASDRQIARLVEGRWRAAQTEEMLGRIDQLAASVSARLEQATGMKDDLERALAHFEQRAQALTQSIGTRVEQLALEKTELEAFFRRLHDPRPALSEGAPVAQSVHEPVEASPRDFRAAAAITFRHLAVRLNSLRWRLKPALAILANRRPSWTLQHRAYGVAGLVVVALASFTLTRSPGGGERSVEMEAALQAQPILSTPLPEAPGPMNESVATIAQMAAPPPAQVREVTFEKPSATAPQFVGALEVHSDPAGAAVSINQRPVGTTPLQLPRLTAGSHAVRIEHKGYERWTTAVLVPADTLTQVNVRLRREVASVTGDRPSIDPGTVTRKESSAGNRR